ncbi:MAG: excalibur calcium-binding domain-containing protein [Rhodobacteraceae bacterium]|nr:excalibur calcium-binding domain-containing protein [Paracoccaceae bacterium]
MRHDQPTSRRQIRAAQLRARTLSPWRIGLKLLSIPVIAVSVAVSIYIRTSPYEPDRALAHLIARANCDTARMVGLAPAYRGGLGYHARNDANGNGVTCEQGNLLAAAPVVERMKLTKAEPAPNTTVRMVGGAKFVKP